MTIKDKTKLTYDAAMALLAALKSNYKIKDFNILVKHSVARGFVIIEVTLTQFGMDNKPQVISVLGHCNVDDNEPRTVYEELVTEAVLIINQQ